VFERLMKAVVIAGASGVVGTRVLHHLLRHDRVSRVVALGRRPLALQHEKLVAKVVDLRNAPAMAGEMPDGVSGAFCCLGTTMRRAGSKEAFRTVDHDAVLAFAQAAQQRGARRLLLVSSIGANPRARNFYLKTKGEAEASLARLGYPQLTVLRPSFIDDEGARREHRAGERLVLPLARAIFAIVGRSNRYAPITAEVIARAMIRLAFDEPTAQVRIVESDQLQVLGR
jgi:uncharacterized protein YbjT (DUF2867 family)